MNPPRRYQVKVIRHAKERAAERFPGFKLARISDEVRDALDAGRLSARKPSGLVRGDFPNGLYAWTPDGQRVYGVKAEDERFVVWTTMRVEHDG